MTRKLDTGRLWFVFNEGIELAKETLEISDGKNVYRIDPASGNLYKDEICEIELGSGDIAVFLVTDEALPASPNRVSSVTEISGFSPLSYKQFIYEYEGLKNIYGKGAPDFSKPFSGEVTYEAEYTLPEAPKPGETWRIRLEGFGVWASVKIGGADIALGVTPMVADIPASELSEAGKITLTVTNTAADELVAKKDVIYQHPVYEIAPMYQGKALAFEACAKKFSFGKVFIEKLI